MAREHEGDRPVASPAVRAQAQAEAEAEARGEDARAGVVEREVSYATRDGEPVRGFLARPAGVPDAPGVVVIHEWWGLNENIRSMTRALAREGYAALAVDLYGGAVAEDPAAARSLVEQARSDPSALRENVRRAHAWLVREGAPRTAVIGWCFGGGQALQAALALGDALDAVVVYYGQVVTDRERLASLEAPLLGHFAGEDRGIPVDEVRRFEELLRALGKSATVHVYPDAQHAFANPSGTRYDAEAAETAWRRTLEFLATQLRPDA